MKSSITATKLVLWLSWLAALVLVLLPFHAFLTVWLNSAVHHYTLLRLWKEFILLILIGGSLYILATDKGLRRKLFKFWPARLIGVYAVLMLFWGFIALATHNVTGKAMWYGLLVNLRFLIFFLVVWVVAAKSDWLKDRWQKLLVGPAIIVAVIAILQYLVLPYDFLRHFGYSESTIFPYETINHNIEHLRVMSTLRGANPFGAYLVLPISALSILLIRNHKKRRDGVLLLAGLLLALIFSFSRSAWIGVSLSIIILAWVALKTPKAKKIFGGILAGVLAIGLVAAIALHNNATFENTFLHTQHGSIAKVSSNEAHGSAFRSAAKDVVHQSWGRGVGTAGPESVYNNHPARIAENYFLQIAQEAGIIGMTLFIAISAVVGKQLWKKRSDTLALCLFASLIGITFINLLSHAWTDDTLAYLWWGFAGIALAPAILTARTHKQNEKAKQ